MKDVRNNMIYNQRINCNIFQQVGPEVFLKKTLHRDFRVRAKSDKIARSPSRNQGPNDLTLVLPSHRFRT